jgi:spore coat protein E
MFKEIVTKAVIGKRKKYFKNNYNLLAENNANTILGCWVINHEFKGTVSGDKVVIDGKFDINIWYSYDNDKKTAVATKNIAYSETVSVKTKNGTQLEGSDIIVRALKQPSCSNVKIKDDVIEFDIEKELGIEVVNDEKVKIAIEDDEEPWDTIDDEPEEVEKKIDEEVKEDFI